MTLPQPLPSIFLTDDTVAHYTTCDTAKACRNSTAAILDYCRGRQPPHFNLPVIVTINPPVDLRHV